MRRVPEPVRHLERILIRDRGRILFVRTSDIDWIESADNYVRIHVAKNIHLIRHSLMLSDRHRRDLEGRAELGSG